MAKQAMAILTVRIPPQQFNQLENLSKATGKKRGWIARELLCELISAHHRLFAENATKNDIPAD